MAYFKSYADYRKAFDDTNSKESGRPKPLFNSIEEFHQALESPTKDTIKKTVPLLNKNVMNVLTNPQNKNYFGNNDVTETNPINQKSQNALYKFGKWGTEGSIGVGLGALATPFVAAENIQQSLKNWQSDVSNPEYMKRHQTFHQIATENQNDTTMQPYIAMPSPFMQGNTYTNATVMKQHNDLLKLAREQEVKNEQQKRQKLINASIKLDEVTDHTPVSMDTLGSNLMEASLLHKQKAVEDLEGPVRFVGEAALSVLDTLSTLPTATIHPAMPLLIQSAKAGAIDMYQNNKEGMDPNNSFSRALITSGIEFLTEKVGIDNLLDNIARAPRSAREVIKRTLKQGGIEATEEGLSSILNGLVSYELSGGKTTDFNNIEFLKSMAAGAISGGLSSGASGLATFNYDQSNITEGPNVLPTEDNKQYIANSESNSNQLVLTDSKSIELMGERKFNAIKNFAEHSNSKVELIVAPPNFKGYYKSGTSYINVNSETPIITTMSHEIVHHIKGTEQYDPLLNLATDYVRNNYNYDEVIAGINDDYAMQGVHLDENELQDELLAKFIEEKLFKDKTSINRLIRDNSNVFSEIYYFIKDNIQDTIKNATSTEEQRYLMNMENLYTKAMSETATSPLVENGFMNFSIGHDNLGDFVDATKPKLDLHVEGDSAESNKRVINFFKELTMNRFTINENGKTVLFDVNSGKRWVHGGPSQEYKFNAKLKVAEFVEELVNTAKYRGEANTDMNHGNRGSIRWKKLNAKDGFEFYKIRFVINDSDGKPYMYNAVLNIGKSNDKNNYYEISNIKKESNSPYLLTHLEGGSVVADELLPNKNIPQVNSLVNTSNQNVNELSEAFTDTKKSFGRSISEYSQPKETVQVPGTKVQVKKPYKVARIEEITTNGFLRKLGKDFGIKQSEAKQYAPMVDFIVKDRIKQGQLNYDLVNQLFDDLWSQGTYTDNTIATEGDPLLERLKTSFFNEWQAKIALGEKGFEEFKKSHPRALHFAQGGLQIDSTYQELQQMYPHLLNGEVDTIYDQLNELVKVKDTLLTKEYPLSQKMNQERDYYQSAFQIDMDDYVKKMMEADSVYKSKIDTVLNSPYHDANTYKKAMENIANLERQRNRDMRNIMLNEKEQAAVEGMLKRTNTIQDFPTDRYNVEKIIQAYEFEKPLYDARKARELGKKQINKDYRDEAKELTENLIHWKDKDNGLLYKRETAERNFTDIAGSEDGQKLIDTLLRPIHENEAAKVHQANEYIDEIKKLKLSRKESEIVQLHGEGIQSDADVIAAGYDLNKIKHAENVMRNIYDDLIDSMNENLIHNGYNPIEKLDNYFLHMNEAADDSLLINILSKLGIKFNSNNLPTEIAGKTDTFRPGKAWFGSALHRKGDKTVYDAVKGLETYINNSLDVMYHIDDIQRLRAFENEIRYQYSDDGMKEKIDKIHQTASTVEEAQKQIDELAANPGLGNLVSWLRSYTDTLANKQLFSDRNMEQNLGRRMYDISKKAQSRVAANMVGANLSSAMTNFIPIAQATSQIKSKYLIKAMDESTRNIFKDDGFSDDSTFLTNRKGINTLSFSPVDKITKGMVVPMVYVDDFTSNVVVRAKYLQNIDKGMDQVKAMKDADEYAAKLIADRSKGSMPLLFEAKNPFNKVFTTFQLEVNNQLSYLFKDMKVYGKEEGMKALAMGLFNLIFWQWIYNNAYEYVAGRRPAMDVIDIAFSTMSDISNPGMKVSKKVENFVKEIAEDTPFIGSFLGGGRLPIQAAIPDPTKVSKIFDSDNEDVKLDALKSELLKLLYLLPPAGGSQLKKTYEGLKAVKEAGVYKQYEDGKHLTYPVRQDLASSIQGGLFGKSAFETAGEYYDSNEKVLTAKQTTSYEDLVAGGMDPVTAAYTIRQIKKIKKDENGSMKENQSDYIEKLDISDVYKKKLMESFGIDARQYSNDIGELFEYYKSLQ